MNRRNELQEVLEAITPNVYFQPPANYKMEYPCIVYTRKAIDKLWANDNTYANNHAYDLTIIDWNPDSPILDELLKMRFSKFDRQFVSDGLNHIVVTIYY